MQLVALAGRELAARVGLAPSGSQIQPVIIGGNGRTMELAAAMQARGFDLRGIRPPTVPEGTARLRIALTLNVGAPDVLALIGALAEERARVPA
jgi:8-amino-7-oxononanoate synthase